MDQFTIDFGCRWDAQGGEWLPQNVLNSRTCLVLWGELRMVSATIFDNLVQSISIKGGDEMRCAV